MRQGELFVEEFFFSKALNPPCPLLHLPTKPCGIIRSPKKIITVAPTALPGFAALIILDNVFTLHARTKFLLRVVYTPRTRADDCLNNDFHLFSRRERTGRFWRLFSNVSRAAPLSSVNPPPSPHTSPAAQFGRQEEVGGASIVTIVLF